MPPQSIEKARNDWLIACSGQGGSLFLWDIGKNRIVTNFRGSFQDILSLAPSPDRMTLVSGGHREVRFWDMATGVPPLALTESENLKLAYAGALALTATGKQLAVGTRRDIALWWTRGGFEEGPKAVDAGLNIPKENLSIWDIECARGVGLNLAKAELELKVRIGR